MHQNTTNINKSSPSYFLNPRKNLYEFEIYEYKNGLYQGDIFDFKRDGYGVFLWDDGQIYIGEWKEDQISGVGMVMFGFGGYLYGNFCRNKLNGPGILTFANGDIYACDEWDAGKLGEKTLKYCKENKTWKYLRYLLSIQFEGPTDSENIYKAFSEIKEKILLGSSKKFEYKEYFFTFPYTSSYKEKAQGSCKIPPKKCIDFLTFADDSWYYGHLNDGVPDGIGIMGRKNTIISRGVFQQGRLNGVGRYQMDNGDVHDGIFLDGYLSLGLIYFKDQERYLYGCFENNNLKKLLRKGKFFPYNLLTVCKHDIYLKNYSYYYKYTPIEVIYFNPMDKNFKSMHPHTSSPKKSSNQKQKSQKEMPKEEHTEKTKKKVLKPPINPENANKSNKDKKFANENTNVLEEERGNNHLYPKETQENNLQRKSISVERSKFLEIIPDSPDKNSINKTTFNDDTPKKVSLPKEKEHDLIKTSKSKGANNNVNNILDEKKPTNTEYNHFIQSQPYYKEKIEEIMNKFNEKDDFDDISDEHQVGNVNILNLQRYQNGPPSFGDSSQMESKGMKEKRENFHEEMPINEESSRENVNKKHSVFPEDVNEGRKKGKNQGLFIYYDPKEGFNVDLKEYDCKYYNLFNNKLMDSERNQEIRERNCC